jgi:hypothetical protein
MNQLQTVTLQTAVLMQVKELANNNKAFSVHDITREVRSKVNNGQLEIPEVEVSGASFRFDIPHAKVKSLFDELWRSGVFAPDFALSRNFNGTYFEYTPTPVALTAVAPSTPSVTIAQPAIVPPTQTATTTAPATTVSDRINKYLGNCKARHFQPTLKHVQSAIKRDVTTGWSCEQIQDYVEGLGYSVSVDPEVLSASQVVL